MRAILKLSDGSTQISTVHFSEDARGELFVLGQIHRPARNGAIATFEFIALHELRGQTVAEYREVKPIQGAPIARLLG